jgi:hypothetical protein
MKIPSERIIAGTFVNEGLKKPNAKTLCAVPAGAQTFIAAMRVMY